MASFIFIRHGQSQANADGVVADGSSPLTEQGIEQARKVSSEIRNLSVTTIVCSPYLRAQQTAETIAGELGIDIDHIKVIDELHERGLGECEGKPKTHSSEWYYQSDNPTLESKQDLLKRVHKALKKILKMSGPGKMVLVVGHATAGFYLIEAAKGAKKASDFGQDYQMNNADFIKVKVATDFS